MSKDNKLLFNWNSKKLHKKFFIGRFQTVRGVFPVGGFREGLNSKMDSKFVEISNI